MKAWQISPRIRQNLNQALFALSCLSLSSCAADLSNVDNSFPTGNTLLQVCGIEFECLGKSATDVNNICLEPQISVIFDDVVVPYHEADFTDNIAVVTTTGNKVPAISPVSQSVVTGSVGTCSDNNQKSKLGITLATTLLPATPYYITINGQLHQSPAGGINQQLSGIESVHGELADVRSFSFTTTSSESTTYSTQNLKVVATSMGRILDDAGIQGSGLSFLDLIGTQYVSVSQNQQFVAYFSEPACQLSVNCLNNQNGNLNLGPVDASTFPGLSVFVLSSDTPISTYFQQIQDQITNNGGMDLLAGFQQQIAGSVQMVAGGQELVFTPASTYPSNNGSTIANLLFFDLRGFMAKGSSIAAPRILPSGHTTVVVAQVNGVSWSQIGSFSSLFPGGRR